MGDTSNTIAANGITPPAGYRLKAEFREPPVQFEGCFTTFIT